MDWFRMYQEFASDAKVQSMSEAMQRRLVMLLCLRCSNALVTLQDDEIAFALRISDEELGHTKALFLKKGFVNEAWEILNWDKRQFVSDSSAERVARHRAKKKEEEKRACNVTETSQNRTDTDTDTDTEQINTPNGVDVASDAADLLGDSENSKRPSCPHQKIIDLYHEVLPTCPRIRDWTPARATQLRARWNEDEKRQDLAWWRKFFEYVAKCDFLVGKTKNPFFADLEWLTKQANFTKVREGKYENKE